jgi:sporulation protein YlmC with PRC-barrel domain
MRWRVSREHLSGIPSYFDLASNPMAASASTADHSFNAACRGAQETLMVNSTLVHDVISSDRVEGTKVYNDAGDKLGSIDDLMIDKRSGHIRYAVLEFGGFLGMGTDRYPLPWDLLKYDTTKDGYVVPLDKSRLDSAPRYPDESRPDFDEDYGRRVSGYYGTPYL